RFPWSCSATTRSRELRSSRIFCRSVLIRSFGSGWTGTSVNVLPHTGEGVLLLPSPLFRAIVFGSNLAGGLGYLTKDVLVFPFVSLVIAVMPRPRQPPLQPTQLQGFKYFALLRPLLQRLHGHACARDRAGNRLLHYDYYAALLLFYFFNPILTSLRGLQQASALDKVQRQLGCGRAALGSLSEAGRVFDPALVRPLLGELSAQAGPVLTGREAEALAALTAVDGSFWRGLPRMAWALWMSPDHRGANLHLHFDVFKGVPVDATLT